MGSEKLHHATIDYKKSWGQQLFTFSPRDSFHTVIYFIHMKPTSYTRIFHLSINRRPQTVVLGDCILIFKLNDLNNRCVTNFLANDNSIMCLYEPWRLSMIKGKLQNWLIRSCCWFRLHAQSIQSSHHTYHNKTCEKNTEMHIKWLPLLPHCSYVLTSME